MTPSPSALTVALLCLLCGTAQADVLAPNGMVVAPAGTTLAASPQLAGTVMATRTTPFSFEGWYLDSTNGNTEKLYGNVTGVVQSSVVRADDGTVDFYWQVAVARGAFLPIASLTIDGWAPGTYEANWRSDSVGQVQPAVVSEDPAGVINWAFGQYLPPSAEIYPGQRSYSLFLDTDADGYSLDGSFSLLSERDSGGSMMISWGGNSRDYRGFVPTWSTAATAQPMAVPVPEPASALLAAAGLLGLVALRRPRRTR